MKCSSGLVDSDGLHEICIHIVALTLAAGSPTTDNAIKRNRRPRAIDAALKLATIAREST